VIREQAESKSKGERITLACETHSNLIITKTKQKKKHQNTFNICGAFIVLFFSED